MRVGVDLDGCAYNFGRAFEQFLRWGGYATSDEPYPVPSRWEFYEDWGFSLQQFLDIVAGGVNQGFIFREGEPMPGTVEGWQWLRDKGHSIHIITDRDHGAPGAAAMNTLQWLDQYGLEFDSITFTKNKPDVNVDVMVDDKPENYFAMRSAGVYSFLMERPWNRKFAADISPNVRTSSLLDYARRISR